MKKFYFTLCSLWCLCATAFAENWMYHLPDETFVSVVSIPGSHDSATGNGMSSPFFGQTQDIDLATQWSVGIRAFDLRPRVKGDHLHVNHGILETDIRFDDALYLLRDSLIKNPSEFVVIHLLYATNYENEKDTYKTMLLDLLGSDELKDFLVDFRADLTVGEMRGKMLLLSRDQYDTKPVGGFFSNWCGGIDWNAQTNGKITGAGRGTYATAKLYMQDLAETYQEGRLDEKKAGITKMLDFSTKHRTLTKSSIVWVYNFASAYSKVFLGSISTADGYRDNATHTHATIIDYLGTHMAGPTGIILMDYVGVDQSGEYHTRGLEVVGAIINNNFKYLTYETEEIKAVKVHYEEQKALIAALKDERLAMKAKVKEECPDVAAAYDEDFAAILDMLNEVLKDINAKYKAGTLTLGDGVDAEAVRSRMEEILSKARAAQRHHDETAIDTVEAGDMAQVCAIYTLTGRRVQTLRHGTVYVLRYADGSVRKVRIR